MNDPSKLRASLGYFSGSEQFFRHWLRKMIYTEGVQHFAEHAGGGAYWLLDIIATELLPSLRKLEFIAITLEVTGSKAVLTATDGNENAFYKRDIEYTDCPEGTWKFFLAEPNTLMLPSEY